MLIRNPHDLLHLFSRVWSNGCRRQAFFCFAHVWRVSITIQLQIFVTGEDPFFANHVYESTYRLLKGRGIDARRQHWNSPTYSFCLSDRLRRFQEARVAGVITQVTSCSSRMPLLSTCRLKQLPLSCEEVQEVRRAAKSVGQNFSFWTASVVFSIKDGGATIECAIRPSTAALCSIRNRTFMPRSHARRSRQKSCSWVVRPMTEAVPSRHRGSRCFSHSFVISPLLTSSGTPSTLA
ncbi:hypothetical protein D3C75_635290 [compost metagenome]